MSAPVRLASIASLAWASSPWPASIVSCPSVNFSRTGLLRSATSATRLTASTNEAVASTAAVSVVVGKIEVTLGYSPSSSREVVRRRPASNPIRPSPPPVRPSAIWTSALAPSARAVSLRVRAGTRATAEASAASGFHVRVRIASR